MSFWTNKSVLRLAGDREPEQVVIERARALALEAMSEGWHGPPYDPFDLAHRLGIAVVARDDLYDARIRAHGTDLVLEYNPSRPRGRVRFSVAHELAHTLFDDVGDETRHRSPTEAIDETDNWQLEMLCNVAAGELLMPAGTFAELTYEALDIEHLMTLRSEYDVSTEALFLRIAQLSDHAATMFAASRADPRTSDSPLRIDYWRGTHSWSASLRRGRRIPRPSVAYLCTAIGYTARGDERWGDAGEMHVEVVGIPSYPGQRLPRVAGLLRPHSSMPVRARRRIEFVTGDATRPHGSGPRMIAQIVNDRTPNWGGTFARALRDEYPVAQEQFRAWVGGDRDRLKLGAVHVAEVDQDLVVASLVAQRGYGQSQRPRLRYDALRTCLASLAPIALEFSAAVHMPRIGAGMAGGEWEVIAELIDTELVSRGVDVIVYSLPGERWTSSLPRQQALAFDGS